MTPRIVAIDHPSLATLVAPFVDELRTESRRFDRVHAANPKPFPSLVRRVTAADRARIGVMSQHQLVGMASLSRDGEISMIVSAPHRSCGYGTMLLEHVVRMAERAQFDQVFMAPRRRSEPISRLGERPGWTMVTSEPGCVDLVLDLPRRRIA